MWFEDSVSAISIVVAVAVVIVVRAHGGRKFRNIQRIVDRREVSCRVVSCKKNNDDSW